MSLKEIQELVKDKPELLKELEQVFERAEASTKIQDANKDLVREREELKAKLVKAADEKTGLETAKKDLEGKLSEAGKGAKPDEAVINGLNDKIAKLEKAQQDLVDRETKAIQAKRETELKNAVLSAAGNAVDPNKVFVLMQAEKLIGIDDKGEAFFHKRGDKGEPIAQKPEEAVAAYLTANKFLEKSSGNGGSGGRPNPAVLKDTGLLANPEAAL
jgi:DNA repair exonuclease SbcCD ATPase subunit